MTSILKGLASVGWGLEVGGSAEVMASSLWHWGLVGTGGEGWSEMHEGMIGGGCDSYLGGKWRRVADGAGGVGERGGFGGQAFWRLPRVPNDEVLGIAKEMAHRPGRFGFDQLRSIAERIDMGAPDTSD